MEGYDYDKEISKLFWARIAMIIIAIIGAIFIVKAYQTEANGTEEKTIPGQFYETSLGTWMAPMYREVEIIGTITMYNFVKWQTDDTPEITASGKRVKYGIIANNCLPFGTLVEINGELFVVEDRMNSRYGCKHFDIGTFSPGEAEKFGAKRMTVKIYEPWY